MKNRTSIIQLLGLSLMALFATTASAQEKTTQQFTETEGAAEPRAGAETDAQWRTVRVANGVEGKVAEVPEQDSDPLVAERGPEGQYQVRHAGDTVVPALEPTP